MLDGDDQCLRICAYEARYIWYGYVHFREGIENYAASYNAIYFYRLMRKINVSYYSKQTHINTQLVKFIINCKVENSEFYAFK